MGREAKRNRGVQREPSSPPPKTPVDPAVTIRSISPYGKISEKLTQVAKPWTSKLAPGPPLWTMKMVYEVSARIWNSDRLPNPKERIAAHDETRQFMAEVLSDLSQKEVDELFREMRDVSQRNSNDPRIVAKVSVKQRGPDNFNIAAAGMEVK